MESCSRGEVPQRSDHEQIWHTKSIKLSKNKSSDVSFFASSKSLMAAYQSSFYFMLSKHSWLEFKTTRREKGFGDCLKNEAAGVDAKQKPRMTIARHVVSQSHFTILDHTIFFAGNCRKK